MPDPRRWSIDDKFQSLQTGYDDFPQRIDNHEQERSRCNADGKRGEAVRALQNDTECDGGSGVFCVDENIKIGIARLLDEVFGVFEARGIHYGDGAPERWCAMNDRPPSLRDMTRMKEERGGAVGIVHCGLCCIVEDG